MRLVALLLLALAASPVAAGQVVYYLHGKFVEENGPDGVHPQHGPYRYRRIVDALARDGAEVASEIRPRDTDVSAYADHVVADIRRRIEAGQRAEDIAVVGASKGAVIAALVSSRLQHDDVRFVLMGTCNDWLEATWHPRLRGHVLSIHDDTDEIAGSCAAIAALSAPAAFEEIELHTGRGHGFLYTPGAEWVDPALAWISRR